MLIFGCEFLNNLYSKERFCFANSCTIFADGSDNFANFSSLDKDFLLSGKNYCEQGINARIFSKDFLAQTNIKRAIFCTDLNQVLLANAALIEYIFPAKNILQTSCELAQNYIFDSKIIAILKDTHELYSLAKMNADAALISANLSQNLSEFAF